MNRDKVAVRLGPGYNCRWIGPSSGRFWSSVLLRNATHQLPQLPRRG